MNKKEQIAFIVVAILAVVAFVWGLISGIPKSELLQHWEFDVPMGIALIIMIILRIRLNNQK